VRECLGEVNDALSKAADEAIEFRRRTRELVGEPSRATAGSSLGSQSDDGRTGHHHRTVCRRALCECRGRLLRGGSGAGRAGGSASSTVPWPSGPLQPASCPSPHTSASRRGGTSPDVEDTLMGALGGLSHRPWARSVILMRS